MNDVCGQRGLLSQDGVEFALGLVCPRAWGVLDPGELVKGAEGAAS